MNKPPQIPLKFLRWFCREDYLDEIEGDLYELFESRANKSLSYARRRFLWDVLRSFRWINIKKSKTMTNQGAILKNYFKTGYRSLLKDYKFSLINTLGLSVALSIFLIMILMINHELSFDKFHSKGDRIFQVIQEFRKPDGSADPEIHSSSQLAAGLRSDMPMVENAVTITGAASTWVETDGKRFFEEEGIVAWPEFFQIFDFELAKGNSETALQKSRSIVISEELAIKYYGHENPIGKMVHLEYYGDFTVSAVLKNVPSNSYIQFDYLITPDMDVYFDNTASWYPRWFTSWRGNGATTYVLLKDKNDQVDFESQTAHLLKKNLGDEAEINRHYLINMLDLHFGTNGIDGRVNKYVKGDMSKVRLFAIVALIILVIACFNYINITTARSIRRTKEVGIRKSIGAKKIQIAGQFLTESFILVSISMVFGALLAQVVLPFFNLITEIDLHMNWQNTLPVLPYILLAGILVTFLAGFYPAIYLSKFSAIKVLKNTVISLKGNQSLRNALVTMQYSLVMVLMALLFVINQQYNYLSNKALGFESDELVIVEINSGQVRNNYEQIKTELMSHSEIKGVTGFTRMVSGSRSPVSITVNSVDQPEADYYMHFYGMDEQAAGLLGLEIIEGNDFTGVRSLDSASILINETAVRQLGGKSVGDWVIINADEDENFKAQIIGVVRDFHSESLHVAIKPVVLGYYLNPFMSLDDIVVKIDGQNTKKALATLEKVHNAYDKNDVMTWEFMDDIVQQAYEEEAMFRNIFSGASVISLSIAILGIIGLVAYNVIARMKEFGIRKILGASILDILVIQGRSFSRNLLIGGVLSIPVSWWISFEWLSGYAYRIDLTFLPFTVVLIVMLVVTTAVVFVMGVDVARKNPVESIKYE